MRAPKNLKEHLEIILRDLNKGDISLQQSIGFSKRAVDRWQSSPQEPLPWEELLEVARESAKDLLITGEARKLAEEMIPNALKDIDRIQKSLAEIVSRFPERGGA